METNAVVLQFRSARAPVAESQGAELPDAHAQLEKASADLAVLVEELSQRLSGNQGKPVTLNMLNGYTQRIARAEELLRSLQSIVGAVTPIKPNMRRTRGSH